MKNKDTEIKDIELIDLDEVLSMTKISRSSLYNYIGALVFPKPLKLIERRSLWLKSEVDEYIKKKIKQRNDDVVDESGVIDE